MYFLWRFHVWPMQHLGSMSMIYIVKEFIIWIIQQKKKLLSIYYPHSINCILWQSMGGYPPTLKKVWYIHTALFCLSKYYVVLGVGPLTAINIRRKYFTPSFRTNLFSCDNHHHYIPTWDLRFLQRMKCGEIKGNAPHLTRRHSWSLSINCYSWVLLFLVTIKLIT